MVCHEIEPPVIVSNYPYAEGATSNEPHPPPNKPGAKAAARGLPSSGGSGGSGGGVSKNKGSSSAGTSAAACPGTIPWSRLHLLSPIPMTGGLEAYIPMMNRVKRRLAEYQADHHVSVYAYQEQSLSHVKKACKDPHTWLLSPGSCHLALITWLLSPDWLSMGAHHLGLYASWARLSRGAKSVPPRLPRTTTGGYSTSASRRRSSSGGATSSRPSSPSASS